MRLNHWHKYAYNCLSCGVYKLSCVLKSLLKLRFSPKNEKMYNLYRGHARKWKCRLCGLTQGGAYIVCFFVQKCKAGGYKRWLWFVCIQAKTIKITFHQYPLHPNCVFSFSGISFLSLPLGAHHKTALSVLCCTTQLHYCMLHQPCINVKKIVLAQELW